MGKAGTPKETAKFGNGSFAISSLYQPTLSVAFTGHHFSSTGSSAPELFHFPCFIKAGVFSTNTKKREMWNGQDILCSPSALHLSLRAQRWPGPAGRTLGCLAAPSPASSLSRNQLELLNHLGLQQKHSETNCDGSGGCPKTVSR